MQGPNPDGATIRVLILLNIENYCWYTVERSERLRVGTNIHQSYLIELYILCTCCLVMGDIIMTLITPIMAY